RGRPGKSYPERSREGLGPGRIVGGVTLLLVGELVDLDTERAELEQRELLVERLGQLVDLLLQLLAFRGQLAEGEELVGEGHVHHLRRMTLGGGEVDQAALREQVDAA